MSGREQGRQLWRPWAAGLAGLLLCVQVSACGGSAAPACGMGGEPARPDIGGQVVYMCFVSPTIKDGLFLLDLSSGQTRRLTPDNAFNLEASWSRDGRRLAYQSTRDGRSDVYVMDASTGHIRRLTDGRGFNGYPSWSPDGEWIAFESSRGIADAPREPPGVFRDIFVVREDGSDLHRLLNIRAANSHAAWAPTGDRISFQSDRAGAIDIYTVRPDGTDLQQLTHHEKSGGFAGDTRWSPDGSMIVFDAATASDVGHSSVYWMSAGGGQARRVTNDSEVKWDGWPDWSPDGRWIVFARARQSIQLYGVRPDGAGLTQLTHDGGDKDIPRWRPQ